MIERKREFGYWVWVWDRETETDRETDTQRVKRHNKVRIYGNIRHERLLNLKFRELRGERFFWHVRWAFLTKNALQDNWLTDENNEHEQWTWTDYASEIWLTPHLLWNKFKKN